jgi:hypothetical protein
MSSNTEVAKATPIINTNDLRAIDSFEAAVALAKETHGELAIASQELGDGFTLLGKQDKGRLCGVGLIFVQWQFSESDYVNKETGEKGEFVAARVVTKDGGKYVILDGGFGVAQQLREFTDRTGRMGGLVVERGLRKYDGENEEHGSFTRYYIDTAASV